MFEVGDFVSSTEFVSQLATIVATVLSLLFGELLVSLLGGA